MAGAVAGPGLVEGGPKTTGQTLQWAVLVCNPERLDIAATIAGHPDAMNADQPRSQLERPEDFTRFLGTVDPVQPDGNEKCPDVVESCAGRLPPVRTFSTDSRRASGPRPAAWPLRWGPPRFGLVPRPTRTPTCAPFAAGRAQAKALDDHLTECPAPCEPSTRRYTIRPPRARLKRPAPTAPGTRSAPAFQG